MPLQDDGKRMGVTSWVKWVTEQLYRRFESYREKRLEHSKRFLEKVEKAENQVKALLEDENLREHLRTGYPEISQLYEEWRELEDEKKNCYNKLRRRVENETRGMQVHCDNVCRVLILLYNDRLRKHYRGIRLSHECGYDGRRIYRVYCEPYKALALSTDPSIKPKLGRLLADLLDSEELREYKDLEGKKEAKYKELEDKIKRLMERIRQGEPLGGKCDLCPRFFSLKAKP